MTGCHHQGLIRRSLLIREYQLTIRRLLPGVAGTNNGPRRDDSVSPLENIEAALAAGKIVSTGSHSMFGASQENDARSSRAIYTYVPVYGASGETEGVLEIAAAMLSVDASVSQKQVVFFAITALSLVVIGYAFILFGKGRREHSMVTGANSAPQIPGKSAKGGAGNADEIRSALVATFSHEIRTPLNTVLGMADLLRLTPLTQKQHTYLHTKWMQN